MPCTDNTCNFSTFTFFTPKQQTAFVSPLSCRFRTSNIPSTRMIEDCIGSTTGNKGNLEPGGLNKYFGFDQFVVLD